MNNTEIKFMLSVDEANTILTALQELPAKVANPLTKKLQDQAQPQLATSESTEQAS
jgi:hypothetical protein